MRELYLWYVEASARARSFADETKPQTWGVAVRGNHAYVGVGERLIVLDVTFPARPVVVGESDPVSELVGPIVVAGSYAYIAAYKCGLRIVDVSDPRRPVPVGVADTYHGRRSEAARLSAFGVAVHGNHAYLADMEYGLFIFDVADPSRPTMVGLYDELKNAMGLALAYPFAYVITRDRGLCSFEISDPGRPIKLGDYDGSGYRVVVDDHYLYAARDEGLTIWDVSDPTDIVRLSVNPEGGEDLAVAGNYAYINSSAGLRIVDVSRPSEPVEVSWFVDHAWDATALTVVGDLIYVGARQGGVRIFHVADPALPVEIGRYVLAEAESSAVADSPLLPGFDGSM